MTLSIIIIVIAAYAEAIKDHAMRNAYPESWTWMNVKTSWRIKDNLENWILGKQNNFLEWLFHNVLVWITDGWHFFQMIFLNCLMVGIILLTPEIGWVWYWSALVIAVGYKTTFQIFYSLLKSSIVTKYAQ